MNEAKNILTSIVNEKSVQTSLGKLVYDNATYPNEAKTFPDLLLEETHDENEKTNTVTLYKNGKMAAYSTNKISMNDAYSELLKVFISSYFKTLI